MPYLRAVFAEQGRVVANGEFFSWPDMFGVPIRKLDVNIALPQFLQAKIMDKTSENPKVQAAREADDSLIFAVPVTASVSGNAIHAIEFKTKIGDATNHQNQSGNAGMGEVVEYDKAIIEAMRRDNAKRTAANLPSLPLRKFLKSMLAGREYFWLLTMEVATATYCNLVVGKWTDAGSSDAIRQHFRPLPWEMAAKGVFDALKEESIVALNVFENCDPQKGDTSFCGQGGIGRVFKARHNSNDDVVIKVVLPENARTLEAEFRFLKNFKGKGLPLLEPCSQFISGAFGAGYALLPEAQCSLREENLLKGSPRTQLLPKACATLFELHRAKVAHGDARLENLLLVRRASGTLVWGDPATGTNNPGELAFRDDLITFAKSCLRVLNLDEDRFGVLRDSISKYVAHNTDSETNFVQCLSKLLDQTEDKVSTSSCMEL
jgi:hypothetical protein